MTCAMARHRLPGYVDGALGVEEQQRMHKHLEACCACQQELEAYHKLSTVMARVERPAPPADLALRIRLNVARARTAEPWLRQMWSWAAVRVENILAPLAVPATGGVLTSLLVFSMVFYNLLVGVPLGAVPNDIPINIIQPARLESLAPFSLSSAEAGESGEWTVEALVDARGHAVGYTILSGTDNPQVRRQLDQVVLFSKYRPQRSFGRPEPGRVILSFSEVRVRG